MFLLYLLPPQPQRGGGLRPPPQRGGPPLEATPPLWIPLWMYALGLGRQQIQLKLKKYRLLCG